MDKVDSIQEQMGYIRREKKIPRKNQKEMLDIKITIIEMKNAFDDFTQTGCCQGKNL